ncbi:hypothetical protein GPECTOR_1573g731 [Gonium pectorale]|uniref:Uncharacterized protein n=1 Tax=Gonium pectorale TaxID=33097 RepID=A0A150FV28_GONPE|nr:hypothetical protein GPECTOR_1573g731 [Gonium pectorale]|eukprot:KXZ40880.1 hypothetical protein GPECTOR_1573g731 [Gonium pectorale]
MACAVAMRCPAANMKFKGDATELVDRLVEACQTVKPVAGKILERELQPFSFEGCPPLPSKAPSARSPRGSPRCSPPKQAKVARKEAPSCSPIPSRGSLDVRTPKPTAPSSRFVSIGSADDLARVLTGTGNNAFSDQEDAILASAKACPGFFSR